MRRILVAVAATAVAAFGLTAMWPSDSAAQSSDASKCASFEPAPNGIVVLKDTAYHPTPLNFDRAEVVVCFEHQDPGVAHTVTFDPPTVADDQWPNCSPTSTENCFRFGAGAYRFQFATPGNFNYHCKIHANMKGVVNVAGVPPVGTTTSTTRRTTTTTAGTGTTIGTLATTTSTSIDLTTTTVDTSSTTSSSIDFTTNTTNPEILQSAAGEDDEDDDASGLLLAVGTLLLAAVVAGLIPAWRRLT